jgi:hypothetical protein
VCAHFAFVDATEKFSKVLPSVFTPPAEHECYLQIGKCLKEKSTT